MSEETGQNIHHVNKAMTVCLTSHKNRANSGTRGCFPELPIICSLLLTKVDLVYHHLCWRYKRSYCSLEKYVATLATPKQWCHHRCVLLAVKGKADLLLSKQFIYQYFALPYCVMISVFTHQKSIYIYTYCTHPPQVTYSVLLLCQSYCTKHNICNFSCIWM